MSRYIDADELINKINAYVINSQDVMYIRELIKETPTADVVEVVRGEWIDMGSGQVCSECHEIQYGYDNYRRYCPNCGANMRGEDA